SQAGFRPLLEAGVRVFEWKGPMLHAKTAVADGLWARVGSSNLNISSWGANLERDAGVEDAGCAEEMGLAFVAAGENTAEFVLPGARRRSAPGGRPGKQGRPAVRRAGASAGRAAAGALRIGHTVGAAIVDRRGPASTEAKILCLAGLALGLLAALALVLPRLTRAALAGLLLWIGAALLVSAAVLRRERSGPHRDASPTQQPTAGPRLDASAAGPERAGTPPPAAGTPNRRE